MSVARRTLFGATAGWFSRGRTIRLDFLVLFASGVLAGGSLANAESQRDQTGARGLPQSPAAKQGLNFSVGNRGLESLSFNGQSLLDSPQSGELRPWESVFRA